jgi:hypothetical protein
MKRRGWPSVEDVLRAVELTNGGLSSRRVAAHTGISRSTIDRWRRGRLPRRVFVSDSPDPAELRGRVREPPLALAYAYLLGMYLGDGHIATHDSGWSALRFTLDAAYPAVVAECRAAIDTVLPATSVTVKPKTDCQAVVVSSYARGWPLLFPQHGPGRKHTREIRLERWQQAIAETEPGALLRGLIHSDGCRTENRFRTTLPSGRVAEYAYPRYFFSNLSPDIRRIFCDACEALGVRWTQSNHRNISVAHRRSVAVLDRYVGPKS